MSASTPTFISNVIGDDYEELLEGRLFVCKGCGVLIPQRICLYHLLNRGPTGRGATIDLARRFNSPIQQIPLLVA
jgi:hypothetical protein